jgi:quercetin dioxygenase-like cupin family protein
MVPPGGGEVVGDSPERRVEILCEHPKLHATWSRFGPGRDGADLHVHRTHHDVFYVLEGELTVRTADGDRRAGPGTLVSVPPMVVHGFRNAGGADLKYLNIHSPGSGFGDYMRGLGSGEKVAFDQEPPPGSGTRPSSEITIGAPPLAIGELTIAEVAEACTEHAFFYVLAGELTVLYGEAEIAAPAGSWVELPPHVPHSTGAHEDGTRFLCVSVSTST